MPELPEVETMKRGISPVVGSRIRRLSFLRPTGIKPFQVVPGRTRFRRQVQGRRISGLDRLGKRLVLVLSGGDRIVFEPRMTGLALLTDPPTRKHLRVRVVLEGGSEPELLFWDRRGLGTFSLYSQEEYRTALGPQRIGPDALALQPGQLQERLGGRARTIKPALLDQKVVAGVGNIYAAECLHIARVRPDRSCRDLKTREWRALEEALRDVLEEAIRYEGSTLNDGTYRNALNQEGGYQSCHKVYGRAGEACARCRRGEVQRVVLAQRATFFCPNCQR